MKIVLNKCFGGFSISKEAALFMAGLGHAQAREELEEAKDKFYGYGYTTNYEDGYKRTDPLLVAAVEQLGEEKASGYFSLLKIIEIPEGVDWYIDSYDGIESVHERHRIWD